MIIPVTKENVNDWAALCAQLWPEDGEDNPEIWVKEWGNKGLPNEFLYYHNNEAAAFVSLSLRQDYVEGTGSSPVGYLEGIYVKPNYRKHGIAKALVEFAKNWAAEQGCTEFASDCELHNEASRLFHMQVGFEEANRLVCFTMDLTATKKILDK